jgi:hypothetical protein
MQTSEKGQRLTAGRSATTEATRGKVWRRVATLLGTSVAQAELLDDSADIG